jgi:hypothetical protein
MTMLACREVSRLVASGEIDRAGWLRRLELRLHLMMCRHCRNYARQVRLIGTAARRIWGSAIEDPGAVADLEQKVLKAFRAATESPPRSDADPGHPRTGE